MKLQDIMRHTSKWVRTYVEEGYYADLDAPRSSYSGVSGTPFYLRKGKARVVIWAEIAHDNRGEMFFETLTLTVAAFEVEDEERYRYHRSGPDYWRGHAVSSYVYYRIGGDWYTESFPKLVACAGKRRSRRQLDPYRYGCHRENVPLTIPLLKVARKLKGFKTCPMENIVVRRKVVNERITLGERISYTFENKRTGTTAYVS